MGTRLRSLHSPPFAPRRKPHLQGRFSGRLATKDDEKRLVEECRLLGPLLGGVGKRGDGSRQTLAKIVRGIASGGIRQHCEQRERSLQVGARGRAPAGAARAGAARGAPGLVGRCVAGPEWCARIAGRLLLAHSACSSARAASRGARAGQAQH